MLSFMGQGQLDKLGNLATFACQKVFRKTPNDYTTFGILTMQISSHKFIHTQ